MRILVAGGGTAGHINPNLAILTELKKRTKVLEVLYVGSKKGMEAELIPQAGWKFKSISCGKLRRYFSWENFLDIFKVKVGIWQSFWLIKKFNPEVIFCKGGYVSLPVAIAGGLAGKKVIIHESDAEMGLANKIAAKFAKQVCLSFDNSKYSGGKYLVTGNPVRPELGEGNAEKARKYTGFVDGKPVLLVMGGSQGSDFINGLIWKNLENLLKDFQIIHAYGKGKGGGLPTVPENFKNNYFTCEYLGEELKDIYKITDLIISRAGANALAEIEFIGVPAVLIPLVYGSRGDQIINAKIFAQNYPAVVVDERKIANGNYDLLADIKKLLSLKELKKTNDKKNPAEIIADLIIQNANYAKA